MAKIADLPEFDMADYLDNDEAVAQYLNLVLAEGDADALGHIAKGGGPALRLLTRAFKAAPACAAHQTTARHHR